MSASKRGTRGGRPRLGPWLLALACASGACSESVELEIDASGGGQDARPRDAQADTTSSRAADATVDSPFSTDEAGHVVCGDHACACDNGLDDDGDGLPDGQDTECTGPYDDDESSFATGIPGDNKDFCQDCFFDGNSGSGDDGCRYHTDCLYGKTPPPGGGSACFDCKVSKHCVDFCQQLTPNGCDCFGCCDVHRADGSMVSVLLAPTCSLDSIEDKKVCPRCVPSSDCRNDCGRCELCPGRSVDDLPEDCQQTPACGAGASTCSTERPCPSPDLYCQQGCCTTRLF